MGSSRSCRCRSRPRRPTARLPSGRSTRASVAPRRAGTGRTSRTAMICHGRERLPRSASDARAGRDRGRTRDGADGTWRRGAGRRRLRPRTRRRDRSGVAPGGRPRDRTIVHLVAIIEGAPVTFERVMAAGTGYLSRPRARPGSGASSCGALGTGPGATVPYFRASGRPSRRSRRAASITSCCARLRVRDGVERCPVPHRPALSTDTGDRARHPAGPADLDRRPRPRRPPLGRGRRRERADRARRPGGGHWSELWRRLKAALGPAAPPSTCRLAGRGPAALFERIPPALLTLDQLRMLEGPDNVVSEGGAWMRRLGLGDLAGLDVQLVAARETAPIGRAGFPTALSRSGARSGSYRSHRRARDAEQGAAAKCDAESGRLQGSAEGGAATEICSGFPLCGKKAEGRPWAALDRSVISVGFGRGASSLTEVVGGAKARVPYAWLWRFPVGPGDTPLPADTSTAGTARI